MHGKDIEIRQGSSFTAFVDGDTSLEDIAFQTRALLRFPLLPRKLLLSQRAAKIP